ncbi:tetratricopeptide repeat protein [Scytonema sp. UIC 10036]|uniref:tetratricopeptide repeat protein n=1 Tax=Scytonema sp. UIC 10036 TaxID=2304196 RepID=UPI00138216A1|nr:tetratricopeptide repeat protein [Scytonema sp. UIC 10036]
MQQEDKPETSNHFYQSASNQNGVTPESTNLRPFKRSTIKLFKLGEKASRPDILLKEILSWTGAQPFLTQKLCQLLAESEALIPAGEEAARVQQLVQNRIINHWETQAASEHFKAIQEELMRNKQCDPLLLLRLYQKILLQGEVLMDGSSVQAELLNLGLVVQQEDKLTVSNRIYQFVFNQSWIDKELACLQPLFKLGETTDRPDILLEEVLSWTGAQPFLTQKLCQLLSELETLIPRGEEAARVQQLVQSCLINHWETQAASTHLKAVEEGLVRNKQCDPLLLLRLYQKVLHQTEVLIDGSPAQAELLNLGLVVQQEDKLKVSNRIYQSVFNQSWIDRELARLRPFSHNTIKLFKLDKKASRPEIVLEEILSWTGVQPFLTQKLCQLLAEFETVIPTGDEAARVRELVQSCLIHHWETQAASEHLKSIQEGLVNNKRCDSLSLLRLYQQILYLGEVPVDDNPVQAELVNLGLAVQQEDKLKAANRIYQSVFDLNWVTQQLETSLPPSPLETTKSTQSKAVPESALIEGKKTTSNPENKTSKGIWILLGIVGLLVFGVNIIYFNFLKKPEVEILFKEANELYHQGKSEEAIAKYNNILSIDSNYYQAWTNRGYAFGSLQEYNKMLESCSAATIIEPKAVYGWNCKGEALHNLKQHERAIAAFDQAIELDSKDPIFWINKTESLLALRETDKALAAIEEAIQLFNQIQEKDTSQRDLSVAFSHKGKVLSQKQEYGEALKAYNQALAYNPNYFVAQRGRGIVLQGLGRYDEAIAQFNQMLTASKLTQVQKAETWYYLGLTFCRSSEVSKGLQAFEEALKLKSDYEVVKKAKMNCRP